MCGIVGIWERDGAPVDARALHRATARLRHRGPDDEGYLLVNPRTGAVEPRRGDDSVAHGHQPHVDAAMQEGWSLAFGFRRLSILDLSAAGHQPMGSEDGACWIVFNGEIYNFVELREELCAKGFRFRTGTDTEVVLQAYRAWGDECLQRFNGMWAFAIWDGARRRLFCARDRFGIKPFYYVLKPSRFLFASEIKALRPFESEASAANARAILDYLTTGLLDHSDETFYEGVRQLPAAHSLVVEEDGARMARYWDLPPTATEAFEPGSDVQRFRTLFDDAVRVHLRSDVMIGTCLSGGLDSSAIACTVSRLLRDAGDDARAVGPRQQTFSSCFDDERYDERRYIREVIARTGAESNLTFPSAADIPAVMPRLLWHQDEPCATSSVFAQWCVMAEAKRRGVTVLLDGQGGDELLAGYHSYYGPYFADLLSGGEWRRLWAEMTAYSRNHRVPMPVVIGRLLEPLLPGGIVRSVRRRVNREDVGVHRDLLRHPRATVHEDDNGGLAGRLRQMLVRSSLPALLRYEDRNSMAFSLEARVPFLDVRLVELAFSLPAASKIRDGRTKVLLRDALSDVLPPSVRDRMDKMGFVTPETEWLRGPLRSWAADVLYAPEFGRRPYVDAPVVRREFEALVAGKSAAGARVWRWINLELWLRQAIDARGEM